VHKVFNRDLIAAERTRNEQLRNVGHTPRNEIVATNIIRPMSAADDYVLSSIDVMYMQYHHQDMLSIGKAFYVRHGCAINLECIFRRFGLGLIAAKSYRYAALVHAAFRVHKGPTQQVLRYLDLFYKHTRQAINSNSIVELVYACYTAALYCFPARRYAELINHSLGLLLSFKNLGSFTLADKHEPFLMRCMIMNVFQFIVSDIERRRGDRDWVETLALASRFTRSAAFLLLPQNRLLSTSVAMKTYEHEIYVKSLMLSLDVYLTHYSKIETSLEDEDIRSVTGSIRNFLNEILIAVPQIRCFRKTLSYLGNQGRPSGTEPSFTQPLDSALMFCYFSSILLKNFVFPMDQAEGGIEAETLETVNQICGLSTVIIANERKGPAFNPWPAIFSLFLAEFANVACEYASGRSPFIRVFML